MHACRSTLEDPTANDGGLAPDTRYCYRVTVKGTTGETRTSLPTCVVTQKSGDIPITRLQLRMIVANVSGGGTDGWVSVALTEPPGDLPTKNFTGINTAIDDLEAGSDVTYDLNVDGVQTFRDITRISIATSSTDTFCLSQIQLIVNGNENNGLTTNAGAIVFDKFFGSDANTCRWVGGTQGSLLIGHQALRASPSFNAFAGGSFLTSIGQTELESRLEAVIGTLLWQRTDITWGDGKPVTVTVAAADTVRIHLNLEGIVEGPNPDVAIDFLVTLKFEATDSPTVWRLVLDAHDLTSEVDFAWWVEVLGAVLDPICAPTASIAGQDLIVDCVSHLEDYIAQKIEEMFDAPEQEMAVSLPDTCGEPVVNVAGDNSIRFSCNGIQPTATPKPKSTPIPTPRLRVAFPTTSSGVLLR